MKALEVHNLTKIYKNRRGVRDVSLSIDGGEIYGLLGPNGAGKTTVMKTITGLCLADRGEVKIMGCDLESQFEAAMEQVGALIGTADAYDYLSARRNLELSARFYPVLERCRIDEILSLVGLSSVQNELVGHYSNGMKQRLGLAGALLSHPRLVILDEPTNGLDIEGTAEIRNLIVSLAREEQITFFVSSHLVHDMEIMCDRVGIIKEGCLITEAVMSDLLKKNASLEDFFIKEARAERGVEADA